MHKSNIYTSLLIPTLLLGIFSVWNAPAEASCLNCSSRSYEGEELNYEELERERSTGGSFRDKVRRLDDDIVKNLFIPILFGVSLDDITPNFGDPRSGGTRSHEGLDMLAPQGTPIVSPTEAVVIRIGGGANSGRYVTTANPGGESFIYMHLEDVADIDEGDALDVGELIGFVGDTGNAKGGPAHLHFEIREGRQAMDSYDRIAKEFSLEDKLGFVDDMLDDYSDADDLAEFLAEEFGPVLIQAKMVDIDLPRKLGKLVAEVGDITAAGARDLEVGMEGSDVSSLQSLLITKGHLDITSPTGHFGPLTKAALAAYQRAEGISPASGYFGPLTRAALRGSDATTKTAVVAAPRKTTGDELTLENLISLFLALGVIPPEKEQAAFAALRTLEA